MTVSVNILTQWHNGMTLSQVNTIDTCMQNKIELNCISSIHGHVDVLVSSDAFAVVKDTAA
jgi:hypothetical protein